MVELDGCLEQASIGADELDRPSVAPGEGVAARRRRVQQSEPHELVGDVEIRAARAVHDELVAESARVPALGVFTLAVGGEARVLHDDRHVVDAVFVRQAECLLGVVLEDEHAGESPLDVRFRLAVGVRVVPEGRRLLVDVPLGRPCGIRVDHLVRTAVHLGGQVHPVPVHGGRHVERVLHVDPHVLTAFRHERGTEVAAVEPPGVARDARRELGRTGLRVEREDAGAVSVDARLGERRNRERGVEVDLADR